MITKNTNKISFILFINLTIIFCSYSSVNLKRINPIGPITQQVAGIIISFHQYSSYDKLFSQIKQQSKQGSIVLTYVTGKQVQRDILSALNGHYQNADQTLRQLIGQIQKLTIKCPSCIVFNWECSAGYSDQSFNQNGRNVFGLLDLVLKRGYMAMFSDFSLKALIKQWNSEVLGENPFVKIGQTSTPIKLKFNKNKLLQSPSSQLQAVAQLSRTNQLTVNVLGGTIMYAVDSRIKPSQKYSLQVLTVASNFPASQSYYQSKIDSDAGLACHVLLSYKNGGKLLTSMGHWIELMKIDTTQQKLFQMAQQLYGSAQYSKVQAQLLLLQTQSEKIQYVKRKSKMYVQNQSPGSNRIYMESNNKNTMDL